MKLTDNLIIFTGEERALMNEEIKKLHGRVVEDIDKLPALMTGGSLFSNQPQTFVVKDTDKILKWEPEKLKALTKKNRLIIVTSKLDMRSKLAKVVTVQEFKKLGDAALVKLAKKKLPEIDDKAASLLVYYCQNDYARLENEVHKLLHLPYNVDITEDLIDELVARPLEDAIFEMIDCIASKQAAYAYETYLDLIQLGESPIKIVSLLYTKFKQMFLVQGYVNLDNKAIADKTGLTFWQVKKAKEVMGQFSEWQLLEALKGIFKAEVAMKTGGMDITLAMEDLLLHLLEG